MTPRLSYVPETPRPPNGILKFIKTDRKRWYGVDQVADGETDVKTMSFLDDIDLTDVLRRLDKNSNGCIENNTRSYNVAHT